MAGKSKATAWRSEAPVGPTFLAIIFFAIMMAFLVRVITPGPGVPYPAGLRLTTTDDAVGGAQER